GLDFAHIAKMDSNTDPDTVSYAEAMKSDEATKWRKAIQEELQEMKRNKDWEVVNLPLPYRRKAMPAKWILKRKRNTRNKIERYKARLVILGNLQRRSEIGDIYSPVVKYATVRAILGIAAVRDYEIRQGDVTAAFLGGELAEPVYMIPPKDMELYGKALK